MAATPLLAVLLFVIGVTWLGLVASQDQDSLKPRYRAEDDVSWAIQSPRLSALLGDHTQKLYDEFIANCKSAVMEDGDTNNPSICVDDEENRMLMNTFQPGSVYNFTQQGFAKIRAPEKLFTLISKFYKRNQGQDIIEWKKLNTYHNIWDAPPTICHLNRRENSGGGPHLQAMMFKEAKSVLEDWTGQELAPVSLYGIRLYHNGSILAPHVDRLPLIISAISKFTPFHVIDKYSYDPSQLLVCNHNPVNVDQEVDEPWPLEVYGHDGVAVNVTMAPGDMVRSNHIIQLVQRFAATIIT